VIKLVGLTKGFGAQAVLDHIDLDVAQGGFTALLGPSGSGKTTLLRIVAGLEYADAGSVAIDGIDMTEAPPGQRGIGFVFQNYALFGHLTVFENIAFGLRVRPRRQRLGRDHLRQTVERLLAMVRLDGLGARLPAQLSGGHALALARALAIEPRILLLDEPFGALDQAVREDLRHALKRLQSELGITTLFVSHDEQEALALADQVVRLDRGKLVPPPA
jgi:sulfate transport system ATP-binding protein